MSKRVSTKLLAPLLMLTAVAAGGSEARADGGVAAGVLTCNESSGWGLIFGSSTDLKCVYSNGDTTQHYTGKISKFGVDIGYKASSVIVWSVFAPTANVGDGALAGYYGGATASGAIGPGVGANVLIGGSTKSIALQPLSFSGGTGLNVAAGIAEITLDKAN